MPRVQEWSVSLTRKKHGCPERSFIAYGQACKWGQAEKNNGLRHCVFCSCVGHELIWGEAVVVLKRRELSNSKRRCWLVIAGFCNREMRWQLYPIHFRHFRRDTSTATSTPIHLLCKIRSIKSEFKLIHLPLSFFHSSVNQTTHKSPTCGIDAFTRIPVPRQM